MIDSEMEISIGISVYCLECIDLYRYSTQLESDTAMEPGAWGMTSSLDVNGQLHDIGRVSIYTELDPERSVFVYKWKVNLVTCIISRLVFQKILIKAESVVIICKIT